MEELPVSERSRVRGGVENEYPCTAFDASSAVAPPPRPAEAEPWIKGSLPAAWSSDSSMFSNTERRCRFGDHDRSCESRRARAPWASFSSLASLPVVEERDIRGRPAPGPPLLLANRSMGGGGVRGGEWSRLVRSIESRLGGVQAPGTVCSALRGIRMNQSAPSRRGGHGQGTWMDEEAANFVVSWGFLRVVEKRRG
jgi:hypothetical protein